MYVRRGGLTRYLYIKNRSENHKYVCKEGGVQHVIIKWGRWGPIKKDVCKEGGVKRFSCHPPVLFFFGIALIDLK